MKVGLLFAVAVPEEARVVRLFYVIFLDELL